MITITVPTIMRQQTGGAGSIEVEAASVGEALAALEAKHPGATSRLMRDGQVQPYINLYVGDEDIRHSGGMDTPLADGQTLAIVPAVAGG